MHNKQLYEYAVLRVVPRVEREEFINLGVVLYCARPKALYTKWHIPTTKLTAIAPQLDLEELTRHLQAFEQIAACSKHAGPIALLPVADRFRWLTATRSTCLQSSKVHTGFCEDLSEETKRLFDVLVG